MAVDDFDDGYDASDYNAGDLSSASQVGFDTYQNNQNQQFGMGSGDGMDSAVAGIVRPEFQRTGIDSILNNMSNDMFTNYMNAGSNNVPNVFDLGGGVGDFGFGNTRSQNFLNPQLAEMYKQQEIARTGVNLDKNPFVDSIFTDLFGDSIDRTKDLGSRRVQEINDLRARQAFGLPSLTQKDQFGNPASYTSKDFEAGRDTQQGMVQELPMGGIERFARAFTPYGAMLPTRAAPVQSQMYRDAQTEAAAPGIMSQASDYISQMGDLFTGLFSAKPQIEDFNQFSPTVDNRQIEDFEDRVDIPDFRTNPNVDDFKEVGNFPIIDSVNVGKEQLGSMNPDGQYGDAAGSLFKRKSLDNYTSPNFTDKAIEDKYNEDFGIQTPTRVETSIPQTNSSVYPKGTRSSDLDAAAATYASLLRNRDGKMDMDFPTFYSQFKK